MELCCVRAWRVHLDWCHITYVCNQVLVSVSGVLQLDIRAQKMIERIQIVLEATEEMRI
ncbi:hypothetical protein DPMN_186068 [Dreissena polymorpha]|uniref:Uncharacterized protein n=1 Tax=Dreissena polymorpha TaxID=45954 RepID=A0A9D4DP18_DREPO|nr:hypothetical protein DPMN_186068 [Dreissena polymorpha]